MPPLARVRPSGEMESTGVYWKPVFHILEDRFECWLLNAAHVRNAPGRKTDVADAAWLADHERRNGAGPG
ncbi:transposase [Frankia sp. AiPs1]